MLRGALVTMVLASAPAFASPPILSRTLPNGLEVLVVEFPGSPLVTVEIAVRNGSMTEPPDYNGLSHLYEHMFFKANAALPDQEAFLARGRELGLDWNGTTNTERVNYFFTTTTDHFADAMVFMRDAIVSPKFDAKEFEKERVVVTGEIDRNEANPSYHLFHEVEKHVFWKYPSRKDPLGNRQTVLGASVDQMRTIQHRYYVPNNSVLMVTGGVKAEDVFSQAAALYAGWQPSATNPFETYPLVSHPPLPKTELVLVEQPVRTVSAVMEWQGPSTVGKDVDLTYAADLQSTALQQPASKFQKALVESGTCLSVSLSWSTQMNTGPILLSFVATPDRALRCIQAIQRELPRLAQPGYLTPEELQDAAHQLEVDRSLENEQPSALAHSLTFWWTSAGLDYYRTYLEKTRAVTPADIARYVRTYLLGQPYVLGVMVSKEMEGAGLSQAALEKLAVPVKPLPPVKKGAQR
ncbi:MAG: M16 family metallopeptidase [Myxococcaceae bacterium]